MFNTLHHTKAQRNILQKKDSLNKVLKFDEAHRYWLLSALERKCLLNLPFRKTSLLNVPLKLKCESSNIQNKSLFLRKWVNKDFDK